MTEEKDQAGTSKEQDGQQEQKGTPKFAVQRIYLKDLSFETPMGPAAFQKQLKPEINQDIALSTTKLGDENYEVELTLTVTVKDGEDTIYLIEVHQAGIFAIQGIEGQQLAQLLNTLCPSTLFPYVREAVDSVVLKGSFPALLIPPVNFEALFAQAVAEGKLKGKAAESVTH
ncbi:MAG: protein-export chaperone SecB [Porticoccus sp.]|nr:protein-export chaperone SecB [Porticoccus sp.]